ncbi:LPXTG cell wall anchor domain-containing protein [Fusicatenibacter sp.]
MKKLVAVLCAAVMTVGMAVNVFAAPSPSVSGVVTAVESAKDADGNAVDIKMETVSEAEAEQHFTEEEKAAVAKIKESKEKFEAIAKEALGDKFEEGMELVDIRNLYVPEGAKVTFPLTITVKVTGVTEASKVAVLHYTNGKWEDVNAVAGNGTITFTVNSLSPFAFIVDANTAKNVGSTTSPATGEANTMVWVAIVAVAAAAGMVVTYRKKRA